MSNIPNLQKILTSLKTRVRNMEDLNMNYYGILLISITFNKI